MGWNTTVKFQAWLKCNLPQEIIDLLRKISIYAKSTNNKDLDFELPDHELFKNRYWIAIFQDCYFSNELQINADLSESDSDLIDLFLKWINPYLQVWETDVFIGEVDGDYYGRPSIIMLDTSGKIYTIHCNFCPEVEYTPRGYSKSYLK